MESYYNKWLEICCLRNSFKERLRLNVLSIHIIFTYKFLGKKMTIFVLYTLWPLLFITTVKKLQSSQVEFNHAEFHTRLLWMTLFFVTHISMIQKFWKTWTNHERSDLSSSLQMYSFQMLCRCTSLCPFIEYQFNTLKKGKCEDVWDQTMKWSRDCWTQYTCLERVWFAKYASEYVSP